MTLISAYTSLTKFPTLLPVPLSSEAGKVAKFAASEGITFAERSVSSVLASRNFRLTAAATATLVVVVAAIVAYVIYSRFFSGTKSDETRDVLPVVGGQGSGEEPLLLETVLEDSLEEASFDQHVLQDGAQSLIEPDSHFTTPLRRTFPHFESSVPSMRLHSPTFEENVSWRIADMWTDTTPHGILFHNVVVDLIIGRLTQQFFDVHEKTEFLIQYERQVLGLLECNRDSMRKLTHQEFFARLTRICNHALANVGAENTAPEGSPVKRRTRVDGVESILPEHLSSPLKRIDPAAKPANTTLIHQLNLWLRMSGDTTALPREEGSFFLPTLPTDRVAVQEPLPRLFESEDPSMSKFYGDVVQLMRFSQAQAGDGSSWDLFNGNWTLTPCKLLYLEQVQVALGAEPVEEPEGELTVAIEKVRDMMDTTKERNFKNLKIFLEQSVSQESFLATLRGFVTAILTGQPDLSQHVDAVMERLTTDDFWSGSEPLLAFSEA